MATESDNVNSGALGTLVAVGTFAMLGISLVVTALVRAEMADEAEKKEVSADRAYRDLLAEQRAQLQAPAAYKDRASGSVSLPIDRAMELVVTGLAKDPNSATPPPAVGGSGGSAGASAEAAGSGGMGGMGGVAGGGGAAGSVSALTPEGAKPSGKDPNPTEDLEKQAAPEKKEAPKPAPKPTPPPGVPGSPAAPAPVHPTPAPTAPSPATNGQ